MRTHQKALEKAKAAYDEATKQAVEGYKRQLEALVSEETKAGNLDGALAVRNEIKAVTGGVAIPKSGTKADLKKALGGTKWDWGDGTLTLQADGFAKHTNWDPDRSVYRWVAVDRRTAVLILDKGRDSNRLAVFEFSEALDEFKGYDFSRGELATKKRITK